MLDADKELKRLLEVIEGGAAEVALSFDKDDQWEPLAFFVVDIKGVAGLIAAPIDAEFLASPETKNKLAVVLGFKAIEIHAVAVGLIMEAWMLRYKDLTKEEQETTMKKVMEEGISDEEKRVDTLMVAVMSKDHQIVHVANVSGRPNHPPFLGEWESLTENSTNLGFDNRFVGPIQKALEINSQKME